MINIINIFPILAIFENMSKAGNVNNVFCGFLSLGGPSRSSWGINMINIISISLVLSTFLRTLEIAWLKILKFPLF